MTPNNAPSSSIAPTPPAPDREAKIAVAIRVRGTVQGVGFRPTVYRLARECQLLGTVGNDGAGVSIQVVGQRGAIERFLQRLQTEAPPLARIENITQQVLEIDSGIDNFTDFCIAPSLDTPARTEIAPDAAICPQCLADIFDPFSRFYRYPFTNCTHCGPRLSIIKAIPYDRARTSMAAFPMCPTCQQDYEDAGDRRFHAQPVACHKCGPKAWLERTDGRAIVADMFSMLDEVDAACTLLQRGEIVAIKGIGGIHLACDATNETAVQTLRKRKHRDRKPFALMARDVAIIEQYCSIDDAERELLQSPAAPIVLLKIKHQSPGGEGERGREGEGGRGRISAVAQIAGSIAPDLNVLGFMLPYTPLHHLILRRMNRPIVLTSGNLSDEPQCIDNTEARQKLGPIANYFLLHDRDIVNRVDDSVARIAGGRVQILRRARGFAPAPMRLPAGFEQAGPILAMGGELKNTFCLLREGQAILSQHLGDLENAAAFEAYQDTLNLYLNLFELEPAKIAVDLHPEYLSTKLGKELATDIAIEPIQHHHAHIAACMAENQLPIDTAPVLGIALDGLGYGADGTLWGGEFLLADYRQFERLGYLKPVAMLGGEQAIYQPWRNTYAHLKAAGAWTQWQPDETLELFGFLAKQPLATFDRLLATGMNSPLASSCGRLFDAVAAALGICRDRSSYEGQGAIALEAMAAEYLSAQPEASCEPYPFSIACAKESGRVGKVDCRGGAPVPAPRGEEVDCRGGAPVPAPRGEEDAQSPMPNPQCPIPNAQSPIPNSQFPIPVRSQSHVACFGCRFAAGLVRSGNCGSLSCRIGKGDRPNDRCFAPPPPIYPCCSHGRRFPKSRVAPTGNSTVDCNGTDSFISLSSAAQRWRIISRTSRDRRRQNNCSSEIIGGA
ncbi:MAG: carbamoyltransferase HypF [Oscillatoriaceae cyanobacterium Prado104]|nr:carbamoyltransferase HypF [Oscillatoriaceae cyanobacterium Prado104]